MAGWLESRFRRLNYYANMGQAKGFSSRLFRAGTIKLSGQALTHVLFKDDAAAELLLEDAPWDFSDVGNGGTLKLFLDGAEAALTGTVNATGGTSVSGKTAALATGANTGPFDFLASGKTFIAAIDGGSNQTVTFTATKGKSVSGASPSTNISAETDYKFKISVDGDAAETASLILAGIPQVESIAVTAGASAAGTPVLTITAAGMGNTPKDVNCAVLETDTTPELVATAWRTALSNDADVAAYFTVGGTGANIVLTRKAAAANDSTMAIALKSADSTSVTVGSSLNTTTGAAAPTTGALIAVDMQRAIRALGGNKASVTVDYDSTTAGKYTVLSGRLGTGSSVVITRAADLDISDELKIGQAGGTETAGTGFCANLAAVTITEVITALSAAGTGLTGVTPASDGGKLRLQSATLGIGSSVAVKDGTANAILGFSDNSTAIGKPLIDISAGTDTSFKLKMSAADTAEVVAVTVSGLNSGAAIASALETAIQALGGLKTGATVAYSAASGGSYTITGANLGTASTPIVTNAATNNLADDLCLGTANGGTETAGTGDCADLTAVTPAELAAVLAADMEDLITEIGADSLNLVSPTDGSDSSIVISDGTLNTALGVTENGYGVGGVGLGYETDMFDDKYSVSILPHWDDGTEYNDYPMFAIKKDSKTVSGFDIYAIMDGDYPDYDVDLTIISYSELYE